MSKDLESCEKVYNLTGLDFRNTVDLIIMQLLKVKPDQLCHHKMLIDLNWIDLITLCQTVQVVLLKEPAILDLAPPITIVGDIHGQYLDLLHWFSCIGYPPEVSFLFLGDYVDRGRQSVETISLLFAFKVKYPKRIFLLRGNHEAANINMAYGFYDECKRRYNIKLWRHFVDCFNCLPVAALVNHKIFCVHGGLSPLLSDVKQILEIKRPTVVPRTGLLCDILWSDPAGNGFQGWKPSERGVSYVFGEDVVKEFVARNNLDLICRAHEVVEDGYEFFANKSLVTVFSAPNYCGEFHNNGAVLIVDENLGCSFITVGDV